MTLTGCPKATDGNLAALQKATEKENLFPNIDATINEVYKKQHRNQTQQSSPLSANTAVLRRLSNQQPPDRSISPEINRIYRQQLLEQGMEQRHTENAQISACDERNVSEGNFARELDIQLRESFPKERYRLEIDEIIALVKQSDRAAQLADLGKEAKRLSNETQTLNKQIQDLSPAEKQYKLLKRIDRCAKPNPSLQKRLDDLKSLRVQLKIHQKALEETTHSLSENLTRTLNLVYKSYDECFSPKEQEQYKIAKVQLMHFFSNNIFNLPKKNTKKGKS